MILIISLVFIGVLCWAFGSVGVGVTRQEDRIEYIKRLQHIGGAGDIFVVLPSLSFAEASSTIESLFRQARYPNRVSVGLVLCDGVSQQEAELLVHDLKGRLSAGGDVRVVVEKLGFGASLARASGVEKLLKRERFVLAAHAHSVFCHEWDAVLVGSLDVAYRLGGHAVTQQPIGVLEGVNDFQGCPSSATFSALLPMESKLFGIPVFGPKLFSKLDPEIYKHPGLCAKCIFAEAQLSQKLFSAAVVPAAAPGEDDFVLSSVADDMGVVAFTALQSVLVHIDARGEGRNHSFLNHRTPKIEKLKNSLIATLLAPSLASGVHTDISYGLTEQEAERAQEEIVDKYGSVLYYQSLLQDTEQL